MQKTSKSKSLNEEQKDLIDEYLPPGVAKNLLSSEKQNQIDGRKNIYSKFRFVKTHIIKDFDIYDILWKDLYWHFSRLLNTMNENNVVDLDMLSVSKRTKYVIQKQLIDEWVLKKFRKDDSCRMKLYMNPLFWLKDRKTISAELIREFWDITLEKFNTNLK